MKHNFSNILVAISFNKSQTFGGRAKLLCLLIISALLFNGCKKLVEVDAPKTEILSTSVFSTDGSAKSAITGMYSNMLTGIAYSKIGYAASLSADESDPTYASYFFTDYGSNSLTSADGTVLSLWTGLYNSIYQANSIIEGAQASTGMSDSVKTRYIGEAKFVRALSHFYLVNFYGAVPVVTTTAVKTNVSTARTDTASVYKQIIADLTDAENQLPVDYQSYDGKRDRANKFAAAALLAKAYLNSGDYVNAEKQASVVINNSGLYSLLPSSSIANVFLKDSKESIFAINPATATGHLITNDFSYYAYSYQYGALYGPSYVITPTLANAFEAGDLRKTNWVSSFNYQGNTYYYGAKYKDYNFTTQPAEFDIVLRLSEQYLIRAEARLRQSNIGGAQTDINIIRSRAGLTNVTATTPSALFDAISQERRVELFLEFGSRWFDLKRMGRANAVLGVLKPTTWKSTAVLYPVPIEEIKKAPQLTQNPGY